MHPQPKVLYLGFAFPPGIAGQFPEAQPAGHLIETSLVDSLRPWFEIRSVGISWIRVEQVSSRDNSPGLPHDLVLLDRPPEIIWRFRSLARLKRAYQRWLSDGWRPDILMVCNFSPVYNGFIRWLKRRPAAPALVLYLADSMNLQRPISWTKRLRHRFKPLTWPDAEMVRYVQACVATSMATGSFFAARDIPWLWLPNGCDPSRAILADEPLGQAEGPVRFGYFGNLSGYGGLPGLIDVFTAKERSSELHICGFGKQKEAVAELCGQHKHLRWHGPRTPDECVKLGRTFDVLVNPRPLAPGNENNFSSKVFEYALSGRAILTSRVSGVDRILGEEAFYFDEHDFDRSLAEALDRVAAMPRGELRRRGRNIQRHMLEAYSWRQQGQRLADFLRAQQPR